MEKSPIKNEGSSTLLELELFVGPSFESNWQEIKLKSEESSNAAWWNQANYWFSRVKVSNGKTCHNQGVMSYKF